MECPGNQLQVSFFSCKELSWDWRATGLCHQFFGGFASFSSLGSWFSLPSASRRDMIGLFACLFPCTLGLALKGSDNPAILGAAVKGHGASTGEGISVLLGSCAVSHSKK